MVGNFIMMIINTKMNISKIKVFGILGLLFLFTFEKKEDKVSNVI